MKAAISEPAREFNFKGNNTGVLLIHGFTGTPSEMRLLGEYLAKKGYTVKGILLKGHEAAPESVKICSYRDWIRGVVEGYKDLKQGCDEVFAVGFSMGGLLALYLARNFDVRGVITLSAPIRIYSSKTAADYIRGRIKAHFPEALYEKSARVLSCKRPPMLTFHNFFRLIGYVKENLRHIDKPVLIMQSYGDRRVRPLSANIIYNNIGSKDKSIIYLHKSGHIITCDTEKEQVFKEVYSFITSRSAYKREIKK